MARLKGIYFIVENIQSLVFASNVVIWVDMAGILTGECTVANI